ncbi:MAG: 4-alpha-glucanotransferase [Elusimicrobiota bacterium]|jgi:glycogen debranching enzyme
MLSSLLCAALLCAQEYGAAGAFAQSIANPAANASPTAVTIQISISGSALNGQPSQIQLVLPENTHADISLPITQQTPQQSPLPNPSSLNTTVQTTSGRTATAALAGHKNVIRDTLSNLSRKLLPYLQNLRAKASSGEQTQDTGRRILDALTQTDSGETASADEAVPADSADTFSAEAGNLQPAASLAAPAHDDSWWKDPSITHFAVSVPLYSLRRENNDPGIGKFSTLGDYYQDKLSKQADVVHLLPHFATLGSVYAPVSLNALNEDYIDWNNVPEVRNDPALLAKLAVTDLKEQQAVDYAALHQRESLVVKDAYSHFKSAEQNREHEISQAAYLRFQNEQLRMKTSRAQDYLTFLKENASWVQDYADFMAIHEILGKPSWQWSAQDEAHARQDPAFILNKHAHLYAQWNARPQLRRALDQIHAAGGRILFDIPMFRAKDSVDAWKHREYFLDLATRNPGIIIHPWLHEDWKDLALWDWSRLKAEDYRLMTEPFAYWLDQGFDGARIDALHFAYNFGKGQLASGNEPGDDYLRALSAVFHARKALPVAEAFEGKDENANRYGFVTVHGDWKKLSSHDDEARPNPFFERLLPLSRVGISGKNSRFVGYTLGDEWSDPFLVKEMVNGFTHWRYRIPLAGDPDYFNRVRQDVRSRMGALRNLINGDIWKVPEAVGTAFKAAADAFVKHFNGGTQIWAASMDWFMEEWGRDTFISLPGLLLATGRYEEAKKNIRGFAKYENNGIIPNKVWDASRWNPQKPEGADYNNADGSMWFIQAVKKYEDYVSDPAFSREMLPILRSIVDNYAKGTGYNYHDRFNPITMDSDGLIISPAQSTWMDADPEGKDHPVTPRNGKTVEINALWYANLRFLARLERREGNAAAAMRYDERADLVKKSFNDKFWFETEDNKRDWGGSGGALRDVVEGDSHGEAIRPNMLFAVSHGEDLLTVERQAAVVLAATRDLLTPYGLRTLSPRDSHYRAFYETWRPAMEKDQAYHQGTVWPWLMGPYADALARVRRSQGWDEDRIKTELRQLLRPLASFLVEGPVGSLPEVFNGSWQHELMKNFSLADPLGLGPLICRSFINQGPGGGTRSQAWSVAETLRVMHEYGLIEDPKLEDAVEIAIPSLFTPLAAETLPAQDTQSPAEGLLQKLINGLSGFLSKERFLMEKRPFAKAALTSNAAAARLFLTRPGQAPRSSTLVELGKLLAEDPSALADLNKAGRIRIVIARPQAQAGLTKKDLAQVQKALREQGVTAKVEVELLPVDWTRTQNGPSAQEEIRGPAHDSAAHGPLSRILHLLASPFREFAYIGRTLRGSFTTPTLNAVLSGLALKVVIPMAVLKQAGWLAIYNGHPAAMALALIVSVGLNLFHGVFVNTWANFQNQLGKQRGLKYQSVFNLAYGQFWGVVFRLITFAVIAGTIPPWSWLYWKDLGIATIVGTFVGTLGMQGLNSLYDNGRFSQWQRDGVFLLRDFAMNIAGCFFGSGSMAAYWLVFGAQQLLDALVYGTSLLLQRRPILYIADAAVASAPEFQGAYPVSPAPAKEPSSFKQAWKNLLDSPFIKPLVWLLRKLCKH